MVGQPRFCDECGAKLGPNNDIHWRSCSTAGIDSPASQQAKESLTTRMNMKESVKSVFTKYLIFEGRASRPEYWWFQLAYWLTIMIIFIMTSVFGPILMVLVVLGCILPNLAVGSRRLHDSNKSGWYQLIGLVPVVGAIGLIVLFALPSDTGENQYGSP